MNTFLFRRPQFSFISSVQCETSPILDTANIILCDCEDKIKSTSNFSCFPSILNSLIGSQLFCHGESLDVRLGFSDLYFTPESVSLSRYCTLVTLSSIGSAQFRIKPLVGASALLGFFIIFFFNF